MRNIFLTFFYCLLFLSQSCKSDKTVNEDKVVLQKIAKNVFSETTYSYVNSETGDTVINLISSNYSPNLKIQSPYNEWKYWNGVLGIAMLELYDFFEEEKYRDFSTKNMEFVFNGLKYFEDGFSEEENPWHYPFGLIYRLEILDDFGAEAANLLEVQNIENKKIYADYIQKFSNTLKSKVLKHTDGTLVRDFPEEYTLWADDLYMSVPFLARLGHYQKDDSYFKEAVFQVNSFHDKLFSEPDGLYYHCWYTTSQKNGGAYWGRANGWVMVAKANLIEFLPQGHPSREEIIALLKKQIEYIAQYQSESGLWHQLLNKPDSYLETSCSAMFTYSIAKAVNEGWIDPKFKETAIKGWEGIKTHIDNNGLVKGICVGTGIGNDLQFYYDRPTELNDIHGLGAVLMAGIEVIKLKDNAK